MTSQGAEVEQLKNIVTALNEIAENHHIAYTITGAADWPILLITGVGFISLIIYIWQSAMSYIGKVELAVTSLRGDLFLELKEHDKDNKSDFDKWEMMIKDCQNDCCPPRVGRNSDG